MRVVLEEFRREVRAWVEENCPESMRTPMPQDEMASGGKRARYKNPDTKRWMDLCAGKGFSASKGAPGRNLSELFANYPIMIIT